MLFLGIGLALAAAVLAISYLCYRIAFFVPKKVIYGPEDFPIPDGQIYEPHREQMIAWMKEIRALPYREFTIESFDGLSLYGKFYELSPQAPIELMFHGYRGSAERDLCGGVQRAFAVGHSALIVDQRGAGHSGGNVITFGVNESKDCLRWTKFAAETFPERKLILTGISMGATTVLMAAGQPLPENVAGVLADCGYTTGKAIIQKVIRQMRLPPRLAYPFVWLGAYLFGRFNLSQADAISAMKRCAVPVILAHGDTDDFVPCYMSRENYDACQAKKALVIIPGAGHGLCYLQDPQGYISQLNAFFRSIDA